MKAFAYVNPANERDAVAALKIDGIAAPIGGGQDLLARMKDYIDSPDRLVNVKGLDATIAATPDGGMKIGSAVKIVDLFEHAQVARLYPAINAATIRIRASESKSASKSHKTSQSQRVRARAPARANACPRGGT